MRRSTFLAATPLLLLSTLACEDSTRPPDAVLGTYALVSIGGQPLPAVDETFEEDGMTCASLVTEGAITLQQSTFNGSFAFDLVCAGDTVDQEVFPFSGSWSLSGTDLTLTFQGDIEPLTAILSNDVIVMSLGGKSWRFVKE